MNNSGRLMAPPSNRVTIQTGPPVPGSASTTTPTGSQPRPPQPYLDTLRSLQHAFPALKTFLEKINNNDQGRQLVYEHYYTQHNRRPGRCVGLQFKDDRVSHLEDYPQGFPNYEELGRYLRSHPAAASREAGICRLFVLEDMDPYYVDTLGDHLGIDPLIFCEQMNTWNFTDSSSIPHRGLPSMCHPDQSFTLRYYEIRTLKDPRSVDPLSLQMTFAINRRRYERWRDIDLPSFATSKDSRHAFVRRCASFWTSQKDEGSSSWNRGYGWDAVILVDPAMVIADGRSKASFVLTDPTQHKDRASLWNAQPWDKPGTVEKTKHDSSAYHDGCPTLAPLIFSQVSPGVQHEIASYQERRDLASPFDELVFYWTKVASGDLIEQTKTHSSNTAYFLLKHIAQNWTNQLELINTTIAKGEYFSDDYQAKIDNTLTGSQWKTDLLKVNEVTKDINYMRRQMNHFWRAMILNLDRLGIQLGSEQVDDKLSLALRGAQKDFLALNARLVPLQQRVESLGSIGNDLANLRAAFKGIYDGEFGLRLSLFASIVFPLTLVASILSMGGDFAAGERSFWIFWASSIPFTILFGMLLIYGKRPDRAIRDLRELLGVQTEQRSKNLSPKKSPKSRNITW